MVSNNIVFVMTKFTFLSDVSFLYHGDSVVINLSVYVLLMSHIMSKANQYFLLTFSLDTCSGIDKILMGLMEFFLNGAELSSNSLNSANSRNIINH